MTKRRRLSATSRPGWRWKRHEDKTIQEIAIKHKVLLSQVGTWKQQTMGGLGAIFFNGVDKVRVDHESELYDLHAKIGQLTVERDFFWPEGSSDEPGGPQGDNRARLSMPFAVNRPIVGLLRSQGREPGLTLLPDPGPGQEGHDHRSGRISKATWSRI